MLQFDVLEWLLVGACALVVGMSKTGFPGVGVLVVPLLAAVMPARESTGFLLPMLCVADLVAIAYWRRHADWPKLLRLIPWAFVGIVIGFIWLGRVTDEGLMPIIGIIILSLLTLNIWRNRIVNEQMSIPMNRWFAAVMGLLAGTTTMLANAAGPIMVIYLLAMRLDKKAFLGTGAWYFLIMNLVKLPFSGSLKLITAASLLTDLALAPVIVCGGILGILVVHKIPNRAFHAVVAILAAVAAVNLVVRGLM